MIVVSGGIGSGKSIVSRILRLQGFGVFDCDYEARRLMEDDDEVVKKIRERAGIEVYDSEGKLQRKVLASLIFSNPNLRKDINSIVHSAVRKAVEKWLKADKNNIFVETAIAFESGLADMADEIWVVAASTETRIMRVKKRDGRSEEEIKRIIEIQAAEEKIPESYRMKTVRIHNDESDSLIPQLVSLCETRKL